MQLRCCKSILRESVIIMLQTTDISRTNRSRNCCIGLRSRIIKEATTSIRTRTNSGIWIIIPQEARFRRRTPTPARTVEKSPTVPGFTTPSLAPPTGRLWKTWQVWFRVKTTRSNSIRSRFPVGTTSPLTTQLPRGGSVDRMEQRRHLQRSEGIYPVCGRQRRVHLR